MENLIYNSFSDQLETQGVNFLGYGLIPKLVMLNKDLSAESKAIYAYFASYSGAGKTSFPGVSKILSDLSINKNSFYSHMAPLKEMELIKVEQIHNKGGKGNGFAHNLYTLSSDPECFKGLTDDSPESKIKAGGILSGGFGFIPKSVMVDQELSIKEKALLAYYYCFAGAENAVCPKRETVLYQLGISVNSLTKYNKHLSERGYISIVQRRVKGSFGVNDIMLNEFPGLANKEISPCHKKRDTQKSYTQKEDTNINNNKNNSFKNKIINHSVKDAYGDWTIESLISEINSEASLPESYLSDKEKLEAALKQVCEYSNLSDIQSYSGLNNAEFRYSSYMLFFEALLSMLSSDKSREIEGRIVSKKTVREKLGRYFVKGADGNYTLTGLYVNAAELYKEAVKVTVPRKPISFMQRMIWNALVEGDIKLESSLIHDFDEKTGEYFF